MSRVYEIKEDELAVVLENMKSSYSALGTAIVLLGAVMTTEIESRPKEDC